MTFSSQLLLTFLLNAIWQIALITALALFCDWLLRDAKALHRHLLWTTTLFLSLILPLLSSVGSRAPVLVQNPVPLVRQEDTSVSRKSSSSDALTLPATTPDSLDLTSNEPQSVSSIPISRRVAAILIGLYALFITYRGLRLFRAWHSARAVARNAYTAQFSARVVKIIQKCVDRTGVSGLSILCSNSIQVPVTVGSFKPLVIVPEQLLYEDDDNLLTAAIGHELVHIRRRDYLRNLINELIYLPISFHPAAALVRRRIHRTREMRCDEIVAERLMDASIYARSLVQLATGALPANSHTTTVMVGIADADILEERVMRMLNVSKSDKVRSGWLLLAASICLAVPGVAAVPFAIPISLEAESAVASLSRDSQQAVQTEGAATRIGTQVKKQDEVKKVPVVIVAQEAEAKRRQRKMEAQEIEIREVEERLKRIRQVQERLALEAKVAEGKLSQEQLQEIEKNLRQMALERQQLEAELSKSQDSWNLEQLMKTRDRFELTRRAAVTMPQAIQIALGQVPGSVVESRLLPENNDSAAYQIIIVNEAGNEIHTTRVIVSAVDGRILRVNK